MQASVTKQPAGTARPVVKVANLVKEFSTAGKLRAVDHLSFEVGHEIVTLFGPSGCGKTTVLRCIAGLEEPDEGEITIDGEVVTSAEKGIFVSPEKRKIGLVFQNYALWPHMKIRDNVAYGLKVRHVSKPEIRSRVTKVLESVGLAEYEDRYPSQLSGGQQQRVALARAMIYEPKVLLLDEPLSNLDAKVREKTRVELKALLAKIDITSVYVTHDQEEAFLVSSRIVLMNEGKCVQQDTPYNIYRNPANKFVASFIGKSNLISGTVIKKGSPLEDGEGFSGVVRVLGDYDIACNVPSSLSEGNSCLVLVRSNEVGIASKKPTARESKECEIVAHDYKGSISDYHIMVGDTTLTVTSHRFCNLNEVELEHDHAERYYITIPGRAVSVIPEH